MSQITAINPSTQAALDLIDDNEARRRVAGRAELEALHSGATPEEAALVFAQVVHDAPAPQARVYIQQAIQMLNVSPEGFMALLHNQVEREDQKVLESRNMIESAIAKSREVSERMQVLQEIHQRISQESDSNLKMGDGEITINGRIMTVGEAVVEFGLEEELNLSEKMGGANWPSGVRLDVDSVQSAIDVLRQEQQTVTSANELNMIAMQQAMQQRGQHLQLVSKVLAMMGDTERAIVGNMR